MSSLDALLQQSTVQLEGKMKAELQVNQPYEALQYVQSYLARKKKNFGNNIVSQLVFHAAKLMVQYNSSSSAGTLLTWFIEDGAGVDFQFKLQYEDLDSDNYCDVLRLTDFLSSVSAAEAAPIVDTVYGPIHVLISKSKRTAGSKLSIRLENLEKLFARILEESQRWRNAFRSYVRINNMKKVCSVLDAWSAEGHATEKPLFFARALIHLLAEAKQAQALELHSYCSPLIVDNINEPVSQGADALAVWHVSVILTELASLPPMPRVDKAKLFGLLLARYSALIRLLDAKLEELLLKAGEVSFGYQSPQAAQQQGVNPMALLQGLLSGGGGGGGADAGPGGMDMAGMMDMMQRMQSHGRR